jgi:hypothetical protein
VDLPGGLDVADDGHPLPPERQQRRRRVRRRAGSLHRLPREVRQRRRGGRVPGGHRRRRLPLRHRMCHHQLKDGLRLLQGRSHAVLACVVPAQQPRGAHQRRLAFCHGCIHHVPHGGSSSFQSISIKFRSKQIET